MGYANKWTSEKEKDKKEKERERKTRKSRKREGKQEKRRRREELCIPTTTDRGFIHHMAWIGRQSGETRIEMKTEHGGRYGRWSMYACMYAL